jgi:acyl carrier protein
MTKPEVLILLKSVISEETGINVNEISETDTFFNLGLDSVSCIFVLDKVEKKLKIDLNPIHLWDYPTLDTYTEFLVKEVIPHGN